MHSISILDFHNQLIAEILEAHSATALAIVHSEQVLQILHVVVFGLAVAQYHLEIKHGHVALLILIGSLE